MTWLFAPHNYVTLSEDFCQVHIYFHWHLEARLLLCDDYWTLLRKGLWFMTSSVWQIICLVRIDTLESHDDLGTFATVCENMPGSWSMRTTYLDRMAAASDPWMKMSCLSACLGMTERETRMASGVRSRTDTECPGLSCCASPAPSAHAPNNVRG